MRIRERVGKSMDEKLTIWEPSSKSREEKQKRRGLDFRKFMHQNPEVVFRMMLAIFSIVLFLSCLATKHNTTEKLNMIHAREVQAVRIQTEQETIARIKDEYGINSKNMMLEQRKQDATYIAMMLEPYLKAGNTDYGLYMIACSVKNRQLSNRYDDDVYDIVSKPQQYMGWSDSNHVIDRAYKIALDVCTMYETTGAPMNTDYVYVVWSSREIKLIDNMEKGQPTHTYYETDMRDFLEERA